MKITREEVQRCLNMIIDEGTIQPSGLYDLVCETLARCVRALPTRQAVEKDAKRSRKTRSAAQTG